MEPLKTDAWHNDTEDPHFVILEKASEQIAGEYFFSGCSHFYSG